MLDDRCRIFDVNHTSFIKHHTLFGQMAEWLKATDCKSVLSRVRRFEPYSAHIADETICKFENVQMVSLGFIVLYMVRAFCECHLHIAISAH